MTTRMLVVVAARPCASVDASLATRIQAEHRGHRWQHPAIDEQHEGDSGLDGRDHRQSGAGAAGRRAAARADGVGGGARPDVEGRRRAARADGLGGRARPEHARARGARHADDPAGGDSPGLEATAALGPSMDRLAAMRPSLEAVAGLHGSLDRVAGLDSSSRRWRRSQGPMDQLGQLRKPDGAPAALEGPMTRVAELGIDHQSPWLFAIVGLVALRRVGCRNVRGRAARDRERGARDQRRA